MLARELGDFGQSFYPRIGNDLQDPIWDSFVRLHNERMRQVLHIPSCIKMHRQVERLVQRDAPYVIPSGSKFQQHEHEWAFSKFREMKMIKVFRHVIVLVYPKRGIQNISRNHHSKSYGAPQQQWVRPDIGKWIPTSHYSKSFAVGQRYQTGCNDTKRKTILPSWLSCRTSCFERSARCYGPQGCRVSPHARERTRSSCAT